MKHKLIIVVNNTPEVEYDRNKPLQDHQLEYLDKMDLKMDQGISIGEHFIEQPDTKQRAHFVAANLVSALRNEQNATIASLTAYLANRLPDVRQIRINEKEDGVEVDINYSEINANAVPIAMPKKLN